MYIGKTTTRKTIDYQDATGAIGGWESSEMRTYLKETIKPLIQSEVSDCIVEVKKTQTAYSTAGSSFTQETADDVWIPSYTEVSSTGPYKLCYPDNASRIKNLPTGSAYYWWLRQANGTSVFGCISTSGSYYYSGVASSSYGVALSFCTGISKS